MTTNTVHGCGGLQRWLVRNTSFTSEQSRKFVEQLAQAGIEDEVVAIVESAYEAGREDGQHEGN